MCMALRICVFCILKDDTVCKNNYHNFRSLSAILDIWQTTVSPTVGGSRVYAASFVTQFRHWDDVSLFRNSKVMSTSGSAAG